MADPRMRSTLKQPDEFVSFFGSVFQWAWVQKKILYSVLIGVAVISLATLGFKYYQLEVSKKAANAFYPIEKQISSGDEKTDWTKIRTDLDLFVLKFGSSTLAPMAHLYRGRANLHVGDYAKALEAYRTAGKKLPARFRYLAVEGEAYAKMEMKSFTEAETLWKSLSDQKDNPLRAFHLWNLGLSQEAQGHTDQAVATYSRFEKDFPNSQLLDNVQGRLALLKKK
jgi:tetratricopeptide (TPR) repeat protein